jgi:hypothetical protein
LGKDKEKSTRSDAPGAEKTTGKKRRSVKSRTTTQGESKNGFRTFIALKAVVFSK